MIQALGITPRHVSEYPPWGPPRRAAASGPEEAPCPVSSSPLPTLSPGNPEGKWSTVQLNFSELNAFGAHSQKSGILF